MYSIGGYGGNSMLWIDREGTRIEETLSDAVSSEDLFAQFFLGKACSFILGNLLLN